MKIGELRHRVNEIWRDVTPGADLHAGAFVRVEVLGAVFSLPITAVSLDGDGDVVIDVRPVRNNAERGNRRLDFADPL